MTPFKYATIAFAVILTATACSTIDPPTSDTAALATTVAEDEQAHETGEAEDGDAHETSEAEDGDAHGEVAPSNTDIAAADRSIEITMTEFAFSPAAVEVSAGETIEFVATNAGAIEHEFRLSNDSRVDEHINSGHDDHDMADMDMDMPEDEGEDHDEVKVEDEMVLVQPGETASLVVTFTEDTTVFTNIVCLIPGHFEAGMQGELDYAA